MRFDARISELSSDRVIFALLDGAAALTASALVFGQPPTALYLGAPAWALIAATFFDARFSRQYRSTLYHLCATAIISAASLWIFLPLSTVGYFIIAAAGLSLTLRLSYITLYRTPLFQKRILIISSKPRSALQPLLTSLMLNGERVAGIIAPTEVQDWSGRGGITDVVVDIPSQLDGNLLQTLMAYRQRGSRLISLTPFYELQTGRVLLEQLSLEALWATHASWTRVLDVASAICGLAFSACVFPFIAAAIYLDSGRPILYQQLRAGRNGQIFWLYKFRTMRQDAEQDGQVRWADLDDPRVTRIGRILRRTHLDELPQFWNILKGEMSLIGPRPERPEFITTLEKSIPFYRARLLVKPGLTGWAQVNFRYGATIDEATIKLQYDLYYLKYWSVWLDLIIIWHTLQVLSQMSGT